MLTSSWTSLPFAQLPPSSASSSCTRPSRRRGSTRHTSLKAPKLQIQYSTLMSPSTDCPRSWRPCMPAFNTWSRRGCRTWPSTGWSRPCPTRASTAQQSRRSPTTCSPAGHWPVARRAANVPLLLNDDPDAFQSIYSTLSVNFCHLSCGEGLALSKLNILLLIEKSRTQSDRHSVADKASQWSDSVWEYKIIKGEVMTVIIKSENHSQSNDIKTRSSWLNCVLRSGEEREAIQNNVLNRLHYIGAPSRQKVFFVLFMNMNHSQLKVLSPFGTP